ncbi:acyl-CoA dehydrogenase family protein [Blastococcus sp. BMG 814]|uniref:Acyl-CoA dehydrogenase family protein n=1 Tax=Blastococcus carthaginiensis TaxID=3050034 RepID=A0ABT9I8M5_9ACTN|nr:acyl-CoA dehydrogenase family protein [Blastococcus carthaginiensis]MDP5181926.1 acyl-CoA dehydrogenase family protein [Blastococcus carthaginiensis]
MDLSLTEEQRDLRDAVRSLLAKASGSEAVRAAMASPSGRDDALWRQLTEDLGLTELSVPEAFGGAGATFAEVAVVLEEAGAALLPGPYASTVVVAEVLTRFGRTDLLPALGDGAVGALAQREPGDRSWPPRVGCVASRNACSWLLTGVQAAVIDGGAADLLLVAAVDGGVEALFAVAGDAAGLSRAALPLMDQTRRAADLRLERVPAERVGGPDAVAFARDVAAVAAACEAVGTARRALDCTVEHLRTRVQFGRVLGSFQGLRHRTADLFTAVEAAASTARYAAQVVATASEQLPVVAPLAKLVCAQALTSVAGEAIQLHGGIAITWEHDAHLWFKRAAHVAHTGGSPEQLRRQLAPAAGL